MRIIATKQQHSTKWSGGTTTELFIYPHDSSYTNRDFLFRISTATVESETSTFTSLPGFQRILMILKESLIIHHKDHPSQTLHPFDTHRFDGAWETSAIGKVTDFNVMMASGVNGDCAHQSLQAHQTLSITVESIFYGIYWLKGSALLDNEHIQYPVQVHDFILLSKDQNLHIMPHETCEWVYVKLDLHTL